jgi:hypothetical protein
MSLMVKVVGAPWARPLAWDLPSPTTALSGLAPGLDLVPKTTRTVRLRRKEVRRSHLLRRLPPRSRLLRRRKKFRERRRRRLPRRQPSRQDATNFNLPVRLGIQACRL